MSACWEEQKIELAAVRLAYADRDVAPPQEVGDLLRHTVRCARCSELLDLYLTAERKVRRETEGAPPDAAARSAAERIVPLAEFLPGDRPLVAGEGREEAYVLNAAGPDEKGEAPAPEKREETRTYVGDSGVCVVRIVPNEGRPGATAFLVRNGPGARAESGKATAKAFLVVGGKEYPFDESGVALLDEAPVDKPRLVFR